MTDTEKAPWGQKSLCELCSSKTAECLDRIRAHEMTQRQESEVNGIPRSTINNKLKGVHSKKTGRARVFSDEEELAFEQHIIKLCDFGFPSIELDFRHNVKQYLDKKGAVIPQFKQNLPGYEWVKSFLKRYKNLSCRISKNIKKVRAEISKEVIENYMENLKDVVKDIPSTNVWNYNETNLSDDPGNQKVICKRGSKILRIFVTLQSLQLL